MSIKRTRLTVFIAAITLLAGSTTSIWAAVKKRTVPTPAKPRPKPNPSEVLATHLKLNEYIPGENLRQACGRSNFKNLAIALNMNSDWLDRPKGEYETTEEHVARAQRLEAALGKAQIIICEEITNNPDVIFKYNADAGHFEGAFDKRHNVWRDVKDVGSYRSRTGMGIAATVKASVEFEYDVNLSVASTRAGCVSGDYGTLSFKVPAGRVEAPMIKANGYFVTLGRLTAPYIIESESNGNPTIDDPYDISTRTLTAQMKAEKFLIIDGSGKEIWTCEP